MRKSQIVFIALCILLPSIVSAAPGPRSKAVDVTGTVVDYERYSGILILKDYTNWSRKQMDAARFVTRKKTWKWMESFDKKYAPIYIKKSDLKGIRKGARVKITGYSYFSDEWAIYSDYKTITKIK